MRSNFIRYEIEGNRVMIKPAMEGILTLESYIRLAKNLLEDGFSGADQNLKYEGSPELHENQLLLHEQMEQRQTVRTVIFSIGSDTYELNRDNIGSYISKLQSSKGVQGAQKNERAVDEAVNELRF